MARTTVPVALQSRLGHEGSLALVKLLDSEKAAWSEDVLSLAGERFDRRLAEDASALRMEFRDGLAAERIELREGFAALRVEFHEGLAALRVEFHEGFAALRQEIANTRVDLFKWSFMFWIGQVAAMALLLAYMLRGVRP